jgi:DNA-binding MarR family transcriptional regulator
MDSVHGIPMVLRAAYLSMHRQTNAHLARFGVTADQFVCLVILADRDGITQQELVRLATSDPNTICAMLVLLEKRGLVAREPHPTDGRARLVTMTNKGRMEFDKMVKGVRPVQERLSAPFPDEEAKKLIRSLEAVQRAMTP